MVNVNHLITQFEVGTPSKYYKMQVEVFPKNLYLQCGPRNEIKQRRYKHLCLNYTHPEVECSCLDMFYRFLFSWINFKML